MRLDLHVLLVGCAYPILILATRAWTLYLALLLALLTLMLMEIQTIQSRRAYILIFNRNTLTVKGAN